MLAAGILSGCSDRLEQEGWVPTGLVERIINIGGISTETTVTVSTKSSSTYTPAEEESWMIASLKAGIIIQYGLLETDGNQNTVQAHKHTAKLALDNAFVFGQTIPASYTFTYYGNNDSSVDGKPAEWYGNGMHFFEGASLPSALNTAANLDTDQSGANYTTLAQLMSVPADCNISATIERVRIPFQHRLSKVIAYVLLDQSMVDQHVTITEVNFSRVNVLQSIDANGHPVWVEARKVKPHAIGVNQGLDPDGKPLTDQTDFVLLHHKKNDSYLSSTSPEYSTYYKGSSATAYADSEYEPIVYTGGAPSYDVIVRPTYTSVATVMYDESGYYAADGKTKVDANIQTLASKTNRIEFEIKLSNDLIYTKDFVFDLDPNFQTVVYLRIRPESVNYDNSGTQSWTTITPKDGYYGVNNGNGNSLSMAGGSWQRAFRTTSAPGSVGVTDGSFYDKDDEQDHVTGRNGQYLGTDAWKTAFLEATLQTTAEGIVQGEHHGDYFILDHDIELDVPEGFVFTGHLDAQGHTIKLNGHPFAGLNGNYDAEAGVANVHMQNGRLVPVKGYRAEIVNLVIDSTGQKLFSDDAGITGYVYHCKYSTGTVIPDVIYGGIPSY